MSDDDFETVRVALRCAADRGVDSHGIAWLALQRIQDSMALVSRLAAGFADEMIRAQGRAERAEADSDRR